MSDGHGLDKQGLFETVVVIGATVVVVVAGANVVVVVAGASVVVVPKQLGAIQIHVYPVRRFTHTLSDAHGLDKQGSAMTVVVTGAAVVVV